VTSSGKVSPDLNTHNHEMGNETILTQIVLGTCLQWGIEGMLTRTGGRSAGKTTLNSVAVWFALASVTKPGGV